MAADLPAQHLPHPALRVFSALRVEVEALMPIAQQLGLLVPLRSAGGSQATGLTLIEMAMESGASAEAA